MEYIYAALLLHSAKKEINEENVRKVLAAAGIDVNEARLKSLVESLKNVNIDEVLSSATTVSIQPQVATQTQQAQESKQQEEKKQAKASEEQAVAGLAALFGV